MIKTVIMCGGRGSRLKPLTDTIPKPLVPLNGQPLLEHVIMSYLRKGLTEFVLCVGYHQDLIRQFIAAKSFAAEFIFSDAGEQASMLQRLHAARAVMGERVFVAYGDTLINVNLDAMLARHLASRADITMTTASVRSPFGLIATDSQGWCLSFEEKPLQTYYVGHMVLERRVLETLDPDLLTLADGQGLVVLFQQLIKQKRLQTFHYDGPQITFNTPQELHQAEQDFIAFFTHQEEN